MFILNNSLCYTECFSDSSYFLFLKSVQLRNVPNVSVHILNLINKICEGKTKNAFLSTMPNQTGIHPICKETLGKTEKSTKLKQKKQKIYIYIVGGKRQINYKFISHKDPSVENCVVHMWKITGTPKFKLLQPSLYIISYTLTPSGKRA